MIASGSSVSSSDFRADSIHGQPWRTLIKVELPGPRSKVVVEADRFGEIRCDGLPRVGQATGLGLEECPKDVTARPRVKS
jgi:hypothetical protein